MCKEVVDRHGGCDSKASNQDADGKERVGDGPDRNRGGDVVVTNKVGGGKEGDEGYNKRASEGSVNWHLCRVWHNSARNSASQ